MQYLTATEILVMHALVVDETGGTHGVRDVGLLASLVERPKATFEGKELHDSLFTKAAVLAEALVNYHVFVDGNKRTGLIALARFLVINNRNLVSSNDEAVQTMVAIAEKRMLVEELAAWINVHSKISESGV